MGRPSKIPAPAAAAAAAGVSDRPRFLFRREEGLSLAAPPVTSAGACTACTAVGGRRWHNGGRRLRCRRR
ncbi:unnamed protein product, partial [Ectocarpus sp. 13 AM-2016]